MTEHRTPFARPAVLIVDDESRIRRLTADFLESRGFDVATAGDGRQALNVMASMQPPPSAVILDLTMPEMDGRETLAAIRKQTNVPVLILTALDILSEKRDAFAAGADDYLVKPFALEELLWRVQALLRRRAREGEAAAPEASIVNGDLVLLPARRLCRWRGADVRLPDREFRLLAKLAKRPGAIVRHEALLFAAWGDEPTNDPAFLKVAFARIRKKLAALGLNP